MKNFKKYSDNIKLFFRHRTDTLSFFGVNQYLDWKIIVICFAISLVGVVAIAFSFFMSVSGAQDAFDITPTVELKSPVKPEAIKKVLEDYLQKETDFNTLNTAPYTYPDPTL